MFKRVCGETPTATLRAVGCLLTFAFIALWHGYRTSICIWVALNVSIINIEVIGKYISRSDFYAKIRKTLGKLVFTHVIAIFGSQMLLLSHVTNIYFLAGEEFGTVLFVRTYFSEGLWNYFIMSIIAYATYNACEYVQQQKVKMEKVKAN